MFNFFKRKNEKKQSIDWDKIQLSEFQSKQLVKYISRENTFELGPRRSGKSMLGSLIAIEEATKTPNVEVLVISPKEEISKYLLLNTKSLMREYEVQDLETGYFVSSIAFVNGSSIKFRGVSSIRDTAVRGRSRLKPPFSLIFYDEYDFMERSALNYSINIMTENGAIDKTTLHIGLSTCFFAERFSI
jgi:hypothetical protein